MKKLKSSGLQRVSSSGCHRKHEPEAKNKTTTLRGHGLTCCHMAVMLVGTRYKSLGLISLDSKLVLNNKIEFKILEICRILICRYADMSNMLIKQHHHEIYKGLQRHAKAIYPSHPLNVISSETACHAATLMHFLRALLATVPFASSIVVEEVGIQHLRNQHRRVNFNRFFRM